MLIRPSAFVAAVFASAAAVFAAQPAIQIDAVAPLAPPAAPAPPAPPAPAAPAGPQADRVYFYKAAEAGAVEAGPRVLFLRGGQAGKRVMVAGPGNPDVLIEHAGPRTFNIELKKVAYLGVSTSPIPPALASQLKLAEGFGLVVDHVEPKGPAEAAGLKQHDVIVRVGDQKLVNTAQLGTLVRAQKPGDEIELTVIREGKETKVKAKLIEKEMPVPPAGAEVLPFGAAPFELEWDSGHAVPAPGVPGAPGAPRLKRFDVELLKPRGVQRYSDEEHDLEIKQDGDTRKLIVKDKAGKTIYEGPIVNEEQRKAVPEAVKPKLEKLEKSGRIQWRGVVPGVAGAASGAGVLELELDPAGPEVEKMLELHLKQLENLPGLDPDALQKQIDAMRKQMDEMRKQLEKHRAELVPGALPGRAVPGAPGQQFEHRAASSSAMASMADDQHSITYKLDGKGKHLTAKDKEGKVLFDGPINTDEERAKIPAEIKAKLDKLENSVRVNQNFEFRAVPVPGGAGAPGGRFRNVPEDPESKERPREDRKEEQREKPVL